MSIRHTCRYDCLGFFRLLTVALFVLQTNMTERSSQCNRAIMVVTDGSPETYEEIFQKYNAPNYEVN